MGDRSTERAAQEYLAAKFAEERQREEEQLNLEAAASLSLVVWKRVTHTVFAKCREWNAVTNEQTLTCKETAVGDLRIRCCGRSHQLTIHFDSRKRLVIIRNTARPENEPDTILSIEGYASDSGRDARLTRNNEPIHLDMLIVNHLRVLAGLSREPG
ncbi:MAG: hypothetical protein WBR26_13075 [Candidatus Acidiferrum sp.]